MFVMLFTAFAVCAFAGSAQLNDSLFDRGKNVLYLLSYGEFDKAYEKAQFSADIDKSTFKSYVQDNFYDLFKYTVQGDAAVFCYNGREWALYIPVLEPKQDHGEVLKLVSADGQSFSGYECVDLGDMFKATERGEKVVWNKPIQDEEIIVMVDE
jgi:hypothetical protein